MAPFKNNGRKVWKAMVKPTVPSTVLLSTACALASCSPSLEESQDAKKTPSKERKESLDDVTSLSNDCNSTDAGDELDESDCNSSEQGEVRTGEQKISRSSSESSIPPTQDGTYSIKSLLVVRDYMLKNGKVPEPEKGCLKTGARPKPLAFNRPAVQYPQSPKSNYSPATPCKSPQKGALPPTSPTSWAATQQQKCGDGQVDQDADVKRTLKSFLNKLTLEKFDTLYDKLWQNDIDWSSYTHILAGEILEKAKTQHKFSGMYANLCARLCADLGQASGALRDQLLSECWNVFQFMLQTQPGLVLANEGPENEEAQEEASKLKNQMLGNIRFIGELFTRDIAICNQLFSCTTELLKRPLTTDNLEMLATLLTVVGPVCDSPKWPEHSKLKEIFCEISGLVFDPTLSKRTKCLFRDVLELREAGWVDTKLATRSDSPTKLDEAHQEVAPQSPQNKTSARQLFPKTNIKHIFPTNPMMMMNCGMPNGFVPPGGMMMMVPVQFVPMQMAWNMGMQPQMMQFPQQQQQMQQQQPQQQKPQQQFQQQPQQQPKDQQEQPQPSRKTGMKLKNARLKPASQEVAKD